MSKICYISLTCEKYLDTRAKWQRQYCKLPNHYLLSAKMDPENKIFGWEDKTGDDYNSCPLKYMCFFKEVDLPEEYDWYIFIDDDTFVIHDRMVKLLQKYKSELPLYIGQPLYHLQPLVYMGGGCGFILSAPAFHKLKTYVKETPYRELRTGRDMFCGDVSVGQWIKNVGGIEQHKETALCYDHFDTQNGNFFRLTGVRPDLKTHATFHYLKTEEDYAFLELL